MIGTSKETPDIPKHSRDTGDNEADTGLQPNGTTSYSYLQILLSIFGFVYNGRTDLIGDSIYGSI